MILTWMDLSILKRVTLQCELLYLNGDLAFICVLLRVLFQEFENPTPQQLTFHESPSLKRGHTQTHSISSTRLVNECCGSAVACSSEPVPSRDKQQTDLDSQIKKKSPAPENHCPYISNYARKRKLGTL
ncbi:hypothetical protein BC830DRAFT_920648 [Chytriomyces sp. MP71]|nr:hypothetical protein BC830DRAFT_920648 [Chytriomyces sp. MP71]